MSENETRADPFRDPQGLQEEIELLRLEIDRQRQLLKGVREAREVGPSPAPSSSEPKPQLPRLPQAPPALAPLRKPQFVAVETKQPIVTPTPAEPQVQQQVKELPQPALPFERNVEEFAEDAQSPDDERRQPPENEELERPVATRRDRPHRLPSAKSLCRQTGIAPRSKRTRQGGFTPLPQARIVRQVETPSPAEASTPSTEIDVDLEETGHVVRSTKTPKKGGRSKVAAQAKATDATPRTEEPEKPKPRAPLKPKFLHKQEPALTPALFAEPEPTPVVRRKSLLTLSDAPRKAGEPNPARARETADETEAETGSYGDISFPVRWWNLGPALMIALGTSGLLSWASVESMRTTLPTVALETTLAGQPIDERDLAKQLKNRTDSPLERFDGRRDYVTARALLAQGSEQMAVQRNLERAVERAPTNVWYRLSLAQLAQADGNAAESPAWAAVVRLSNAEPTYWRQVARQSLRTGQLEEGLAAYGKLLERRPEETGEVLQLVTERGAATEQSLAIVPLNGVAVLQAAEFLRSAGRTDWRDYAATKLSELTGRTKSVSAEEWASRAMLHGLLGETEPAIVAMQTALALRPQVQEWKLSLAQLHYSKESYDESNLLAEQVIQAQPTSELAAQARLLREKIELASGGLAGQTLPPPPAAN